MFWASRYFTFVLQATVFLLIFSCSSQKFIERSAKQNIYNNSALKNAHVGISIYDVGTKKYLYNHNADKYFVPASNTKIATCYVAMKYLGDSLPGIKIDEFEDRLVLSGTGDPCLLDPEFKNQPVFEFLAHAQKPLFAKAGSFKASPWGSGWSWSDYDADYMAERSALPIYSNLVWFYGKKGNVLDYFPKGLPQSNPFTITTSGEGPYLKNVSRDFRTNTFKMALGGTATKEIRVPFISSEVLAWQLLSDTLHKKITLLQENELGQPSKRQLIYSQPTDSLLRIMMYRSDNFFAEQMLLMSADARIKELNDNHFIDTVLQTDLNFLPQPPRWADGSGLSRYNLFTPQDFVALLGKMISAFGQERLKAIFPTGGEGTLAAYYKEDKGYIFAKTGTLSGVVALSGFLNTTKNRTLLFSVLVNNHNASATEIRRAVEKFLKKTRKKF